MDSDEDFRPQNMRIRDCKFNLKRENGVFFAGEIVEGSVIYKISRREKIRDLTLCLDGRANTAFCEKNGIIYDASTNREDLEYYMSYDNFYYKCTTLVTNKILGPGIHTYEFKIAIGNSCFSSFEGTYGQIRYELTFTKNKNERHRKHRHAITVLRNEDLNFDSSNKNGRTSRTQISTSFSSLLTGRGNLILKTLFSGYVPGQTIKYILDVHKSRLERLSNFRVVLIRKTTYKCIYPRLKEVTEEIELSESICSDDDDTFFVRTGGLSIPSTPPTIYTDLIATEYIVRAEMKATFLFSSYIRTEVKVKIGTIPVVESLLPNQYLVKKTTTNEKGAGTSSSTDEKFQPCIIKEGFFNGIRFVDRDISSDERITNWMPSYPCLSMPLTENKSLIAETEL